MKLLIPVLLLTSALTLSSCTETRQVWAVDRMIEAIGEVTTESEDAIVAAEEAYEALSEEAKRTVKNLDDLRAAREAFEQAQADTVQYDARQNYLGKWILLNEALGCFTPIDYWFGPLELKSEGLAISDASRYTWSVNDDESQIVLTGSRGKVTLDILDEGDFIRLLGPNQAYSFIRAEDAEDYIASRFVLVRIKPDNISQYISAPVCVGTILDEKEKPTGNSAWVLPSPVYRRGLLYYGRSEDFYYTLVRNGTDTLNMSYPYDSLAAPEYTHFALGKDAGGTLIYIRSDYVVSNEISLRTRTLTLKDGTIHTTSQNWYVDVADYTEYPF